MVAPTRLGRRALLAGAVGWSLGACARGGGPSEGPLVGDDERVAQKIAYGEDPSQYAELTLPSGQPRGVVVVIHGGFWKAAYDAALGRPLAARLAERGWAAWNVEYRRVGNGGGYPSTLDDVHAALEAAAGHVADLSTVVTLGHSAGGHLATWSAARARFERWRPSRVAVTHVVSQAGVLDLARAHRDGLGTGAVAAFLGSGPDAAAYDLADPQRQLPLDVPVWCVHARDDDTVPFAQSADYVAAATAAGATAELVEVTGGHFGVVDVESSAWARIERILDTIG